MGKLSMRFILFLSVLISVNGYAFSNSSEERLLCLAFVDEFSESVAAQLKMSLDPTFCDSLNENQIKFISKPLPETGIEKVALTLSLSEKAINCEVDQIALDDSAFTHIPSQKQGQKFYFSAGGKGCTVTETVNGALKTSQLIKKFAKYDGKPLKDIIGVDQYLTFYYPNNVDVKVPYPNGGSLFTPFAFKGVGTTIYASAEKTVIQTLLYLTGMAPVMVRENGRERALVMLIIYNFHDSGVGPYAEFQVAPLIQPDIQGQSVGPFKSIKEFVNGIDTSPSRGLSKSFNGKISAWQNHLFISSYNSAFAEIAIKGGRGVSYPKFLAEQQQLAHGKRLTTWVSQPKTAVGDEFQFRLTAIFPQDIAALQYEQHLDQSLVHSNYSPTTSKWNNVIVQANSKDSVIYAAEFEPKGVLNFGVKSAIAQRLSAMRLKPLLAQISMDIKAATWTTKRDAGPVFYDESSFMNPIPSPQ